MTVFEELLKGFAAEPGPGQFRCAICQQIFDKALSEAEAEAQLAKEYPGADIDDCDLICDDCFQIVRAQ